MLYPISIPKPDSAEDPIGYIDPSGRVAVKPTLRSGAYFSEGFASVCRYDGLSGFIDTEGEIKIPFKYCGLGLFHEGLCPNGLRRQPGRAPGARAIAGRVVYRCSWLSSGPSDEVAYFEIPRSPSQSFNRSVQLSTGAPGRFVGLNPNPCVP
jgi:hypothetical protein